MLYVIGDGRSIDFKTFVSVDLRTTINTEQLIERRTLGVFLDLYETGDSALLRVLHQNSGLHVGFDWSFENTDLLNRVVEDCVNAVTLSGLILMQEIVTDFRADWIGFMPIDMEHTMRYSVYTVGEAISMNHNIVRFQYEFLQNLYKHPLAQQNCLLNDRDYRYWYFKQRTGNTDQLIEAYHYYMQGIHTILGISRISRDIVNMDIGCHYLSNPELFEELLNFSKLKGEIDD